VEHQRAKREGARGDRVPIEDAERRSRREVSEKREPEPSVRVEGQAAEEVPQRRAETDGEKRAGQAEDRIPPGAPHRVLDVPPKLDGDAAQQQAPQDHEDREIEAGKPRGEHTREGDEERAAGGEKPDLVRIPVRPDGRHDLTSLGVSRATQRCRAPAPGRIHRARRGDQHRHDDPYQSSIMVSLAGAAVQPRHQQQERCPRTK
jgi:hypothetical protein